MLGLIRAGRVRLFRGKYVPIPQEGNPGAEPAKTKGMPRRRRRPAACHLPGLSPEAADSRLLKRAAPSMWMPTGEWARYFVGRRQAYSLWGA